MSTAQTIEQIDQFNSVIRLPMDDFTEDQFFEFCILNKGLRIERKADGKITIMSPTSSLTGRWNARISGKLFTWNEEFNLGEVFDSSSGFTLPNGAVFSPDASWISSERWNSLEKSEHNKFAAICPDFVIELRSASDNLSELREKMQEYMSNGCRLAWLIDSAKKETTVYSSDGNVTAISFDQKLDGAEVLPGFELTLKDIITE